MDSRFSSTPLSRSGAAKRLKKEAAKNVGTAVRNMKNMKKTVERDERTEEYDDKMRRVRWNLNLKK